MLSDQNSSCGGRVVRKNNKFENLEVGVENVMYMFLFLEFQKKYTRKNRGGDCYYNCGKIMDEMLIIVV